MFLLYRVLLNPSSISCPFARSCCELQIFPVRSCCIQAPTGTGKTLCHLAILGPETFLERKFCWNSWLALICGSSWDLWIFFLKTLNFVTMPTCIYNLFVVKSWHVTSCRSPYDMNNFFNTVHMFGHSIWLCAYMFRCTPGSCKQFNHIREICLKDLEIMPGTKMVKVFFFLTERSGSWQICFDGSHTAVSPTFDTGYLLPMLQRFREEALKNPGKSDLFSPRNTSFPEIKMEETGTNCM